MDEVAHQRIELTCRKVKEVKQEGEKKVSQMKQQLREEQTKYKQREEEIDKLKRYDITLESHPYAFTHPHPHHPPPPPPHTALLAQSSYKCSFVFPMSSRFHSLTIGVRIHKQ